MRLLPLVLFAALSFAASPLSAQAVLPAESVSAAEPAPVGRIILGATLGTLATVGAIWGINYAITGGRDVEPLFLGPAIAVSPLIASLGAHLGNRRGGGNGTYHASLLGALLGSALGGSIAFFGWGKGDSAAPIAAIIAGPILQGAGAALGSWLSHRARTPRRLTLLPAAVPTPGGMALTLSSYF